MSRHPFQVSPKVVGFLLVVALLAVSLAPLGRMATASTDDKILHVWIPYFPDHFDPQLSISVDIFISMLDFEALTRLDANLDPVPGAAESWDFNADGTTLTFHLRPGLTYGDGSPLTAERFRYAFERTCDPKVASPNVSYLADLVGCQDFADSLAGGDEASYAAAKAKIGVRAVDDRMLEVHFLHPSPAFPLIASSVFLSPVRQEFVEEGGDGWSLDPAKRVGNGPFNVADVEPGQRIRLVANARYWGGRPKMDGIDFIVAGDPAVALEAYRAGDLDVVLSGSATIQSDPALAAQVVRHPLAQIFFLALDLKQEPFTDKKVREAFAYGFDRETFCTVVSNGDCTPALSAIPAGMPGAIDTDAYAFDPEKARAALAASSYGSATNLPTIRLTYPADFGPMKTWAEWTAGQYRDVLGVEIELVPITEQEQNSAIQQGGPAPQMSAFGYGDIPDPQAWLGNLFVCGTPFYAQPNGYCNPDFDNLVQQANGELDPAKRLALYQEAGELLVADAPVVFLWVPSRVWLVNPDVTGYVTTPLDFGWPGMTASVLTIDKD